jgi:hypothetical protein
MRGVLSSDKKLVHIRRTFITFLPQIVELDGSLPAAAIHVVLPRQLKVKMVNPHMEGARATAERGGYQSGLMVPLLVMSHDGRR